MILTLDQVLEPAERAQVDALGAGARFVDGLESAGPRLAGIKRNEQIALGDPALAPLTAIVLGALKRRPEFIDAVYPRQLHSLRVARYRPCMQYGARVDAPLMGDAQAFRSDLSLTLDRRRAR